MEIIPSRKFQKQAKKLLENKKNLKERVNFCIKDFSKLQKQSQCYRKKLKGKWYGCDELEVGGDMRMIIKIDEERNEAVLLQIGTHSQLFG